MSKARRISARKNVQESNKKQREKEQNWYTRHDFSREDSFKNQKPVTKKDLQDELVDMFTGRTGPNVQKAPSGTTSSLKINAMRMKQADEAARKEERKKKLTERQFNNAFGTKAK